MDKVVCYIICDVVGFLFFFCAVFITFGQIFCGEFYNFTTCQFHRPLSFAIAIVRHWQCKTCKGNVTNNTKFQDVKCKVNLLLFHDVFKGELMRIGVFICIYIISVLVRQFDVIAIFIFLVHKGIGQTHCFVKLEFNGISIFVEKIITIFFGKIIFVFAFVVNFKFMQIGCVGFLVNCNKKLHGFFANLFLSYYNGFKGLLACFFINDRDLFSLFIKLENKFTIFIFFHFPKGSIFCDVLIDVNHFSLESDIENLAESDCPSIAFNDLHIFIKGSEILLNFRISP